MTRSPIRCGPFVRRVALAFVAVLIVASAMPVAAQDVRAVGRPARAVENATVRIAEGRRLLEAGDYAGVRRMLLPLAGDPRADIAGEAEELLGTAAYWSGDFTRAARHFRAAIRLVPADRSARRQLDEILAASAAWLTISGEARRDDQPLDGNAATLDMGWHPTPLTSVGLRVQPMHLTSTARTLVVSSVELRAGGYIVPLRLEAEVRGGMVQREPLGDQGEESIAALGSLSLGLRLPAGFALRGLLERSPYLWTEGSLDTPIEQDAASARVEWAPRSGWLGEAGGGVVRFPDDNIVVSTHVWVLAPLVRRAPVELRAGYAFGLQDSRESRFVPDGGAGPPGSGRGAGRYVPYYTPEMVIAHSAVGAVSLRLRSGLALAIDGSVGMYASELAPTAARVAPGSGQSGLDFQRRMFRPLRGRGVLTVPVTRGLRLEVAAERTAGAFYEADVVTVRVHYRRLPRALAPDR